MNKFLPLLVTLIIFNLTNVYGTTNFSTSTINQDDLFAYDIEVLGDLDGDGVNDIAVGSPNDNDGGKAHGAVYILFLNSDGTVKSSQKISSIEGNFKEKLDPYDSFGRAISNIGDFNGDGVTDIVVGAYHDDDGGINTGAVYILFLNSDGTVKSSQKISSIEGNFKGVLDSGDCWGNAISSLNDFDGDGITDIAVGAHKNYSPGSENKRIGAVHILLLNSDGTVKSSQEISDTEGNFDALNENDTFGIDLASLNDLDGDGITDIAVGANGDSESGLLTGAVYILFLNSDGTVKSYQKISSEQSNFQLTLDDSDMFGSSVGSIGDLDGDGITDLVVGSPGDDDTKEIIKMAIEQNQGSSRGAVYILFLNSDGTVKSSQKISSIEGNFKQNLQPPDVFGFSSSGIGDLDGDGITDISVGSPHRHYYDSELSPLHILFLENDGTVKSFNTIPKENNSQIDYEIFLLLGMISLFIIIPLIIIKIKFKNRESKILEK
tara:strand:- start:304 stop:1779 length:1476 start_codon:yes stop_codon:yes gene_type:complete